MIKEVIQQIKEAIPLHEYMEQSGIHFTSRTSESWKAQCWLHEDKTPSLVVSVGKGLYNCFSTGCEARGDVITFFEQFNACDRGTAIRELAEIAGVAPADEKRDPQQERLKGIMAKLTEECTLQLLGSKTAFNYVRSRGVSESTIVDFQIGFSPSSSWVKSLFKDLSPSLVRSLELDSFKYQNALTFPCQDPISGMTAHFVRPFGATKSKYMGPSSSNPTRWPGMMFGLPVARAHYRKKGELILVEGQFDCLTLHSYGFQNTVCMLGSKPSAEQFRVLESCNIRKATILFDGDKAGDAGADVCFNTPTKVKLAVSFIPSGDPDEFVVKEGVEVLRDILSQALLPVDYIINKYAGEMDGDTHDIATGLKKAVNALSKLPSEDLLSGLVALSRKSGLPADALLDLITEEKPEVRAVVESERQILATCLQDITQLPLAAGLPEDVWVLAKHRSLFAALLTLEERNVTKATETLIRQLLGETTPFDAGLFTLECSNFDFHLERIREAHVRRQVLASAKKLAREATNAQKPVGEIIGAHLSDMSSAASPTAKVEFTAEAVVTKAMEFIEDRMANPGVLPGLDLGTHWSNTTKVLLGLQKDRLYLLGAGPKVGKTSLGLNWAVTCAVERKVPLLWVNLEMSENDLAMRCLAVLSGVSSLRIQAGTLGTKEKEILDTKAAEFYSSPFHILNAFGMSVQEVLAAMRKYVYTHSIGLAFLDYVQLLNVSGEMKGASYWERHSFVSTQLKQAINNGLGIPVVALSQLGRPAQAEDSSSGAFIGGSYKYVQDCDTFMGLRTRTDKEMEDGLGGNLVLNVEYNRHGPQDVFTRVHFNRDNLRMEEIE